MLQSLVGYVSDLDIAAGWAVISADAQFFATTKRLHSLIHGQGDGGLTAADAGHYAGILDANAAELLATIRPGDRHLLRYAELCTELIAGAKAA